MKPSSWLMVALGAGVAGLLVARSSKKVPQTTVSAIVDAPLAATFDYIVPVDLTRIFLGTVLIPAIVDMSIKDGWNKPGLVRTITFADGSTSQESLLTVRAPTSFSYQNEGFTSLPLRLLLQRLEGEWHFTEPRDGRTNIEWTYRAVPVNGLARVLVQLVLMPQVRTMLTNALAILKDDLNRMHYPAVKARMERVSA
ncbi:SRPBCC family protein [Hymenobacter bucti]|uniref:SRPBCC family protein n=1 Tax=Hymenobacter bucti TaxID=1844114 RepID=A0ABW4R0R9_9BACT